MTIINVLQSMKTGRMGHKIVSNNSVSQNIYLGQAKSNENGTVIPSKHS
jgi:hypothetical protein